MKYAALRLTLPRNPCRNRLMQVFRDTANLPSSAKGAVVALGNFDGLHLGHRAVLESAATLAKKLGAPQAVMSFEPHPRRLFNPSLPPLRIVPLNEKLRLLCDAGVEILLLQRFTREFSQLTAEDFIHKILCQNLAIKGLVTGEDFIFGYQRGGNAAMLHEASRAGHFEYIAVAQHLTDNATSSSSRIREALAAGRMDEAAILLGRPYSLTGPIIKGAQRGREWGFPTANLRPNKLFLPAYGIYAVRLISDSTSYDGVASFGIRPMYPLEKPLLEVHLFDASPDLYGKRVRVEMLHYLRPEAKFENETALKLQISQDCTHAREWLKAARAA